MKKMMIALATSALALTGASTAWADTFSPPSSTAVFEGSVTVKKDIELECDMTATVATGALNGSGDNTAAVTSADLTGGLCGLVNFTNFNWPVTVTASSGGAATQLQIANVQVNTLFSSCGPGNVSVAWSNGPAATITFAGGTTLGGCTIAGTLTQVSGPAITIAP